MGMKTQTFISYIEFLRSVFSININTPAPEPCVLLVRTVCVRVHRTPHCSSNRRTHFSLYKFQREEETVKWTQTQTRCLHNRIYGMYFWYVWWALCISQHHRHKKKYGRKIIFLSILYVLRLLPFVAGKYGNQTTSKEQCFKKRGAICISCWWWYSICTRKLIRCDVISSSCFLATFLEICYT